MDARMQARRELEMDLRNALATRVRAHYQPLVNLQNNEISALRSAVRWHHPDPRHVPAGRFHSARGGNRPDHPDRRLGDRKACAEAANWPDDVKVAVNLSPAQFKSRNLVQVVLNALAASGMSPQQAGARDHRNRAAAEHVATLATLHRAARARRPDLDGRFRHRLLVARAICGAFPSTRSRSTAPSSGTSPTAPSRTRSSAPSPASPTISASSRPPKGSRRSSNWIRCKTIGCTEMQGQLLQPGAAGQRGRRAVPAGGEEKACRRLFPAFSLPSLHRSKLGHRRIVYPKFLFFLNTPARSHLYALRGQPAHVSHAHGRLRQPESYLLIDELEEALASGRGRDCEKIIQRVADLFMAGSRRYSDQQIALFDDVLLRLATEIEMKARAKLAQRLARVDNAPPKLIRVARLRRGDRRGEARAVLLAPAQRGRPGRKCEGQEPGAPLCHRPAPRR